MAFDKAVGRLDHGRRARACAATRYAARQVPLLTGGQHPGVIAFVAAWITLMSGSIPQHAMFWRVRNRHRLALHFKAIVYTFGKPSIFYDLIDAPCLREANCSVDISYSQANNLHIYFYRVDISLCYQ